MSEKLFFVAGITGKVGGVVARELLAGGHRVRALVRDPQRAAAWSDRGVDVRQGDLDDGMAVASALQGVDGAFLLMLPTMAPSPDFHEAKATAASYVAALRQTLPPRLVTLSSIGSEKGERLGNITSTHLMEEALRTFSTSLAFVRAGSFYENYLYGLQAAPGGWLDSFLVPTARPVPMIATEDIGKEVAALLSGKSWSGTRVVEIGSPVSPDELAQAISEATGHEVKARAVPREHWTAALEGMGLPKGGTAPFEEMEDGMNSGWIAFGVPGTEPVPATLSPAAFFRRAKESQQASAT